MNLFDLPESTPSRLLAARRRLEAALLAQEYNVDNEADKEFYDQEVAAAKDELQAAEKEAFRSLAS